MYYLEPAISNIEYARNQQQQKNKNCINIENAEAIFLMHFFHCHQIENHEWHLKAHVKNKYILNKVNIYK